MRRDDHQLLFIQRAGHHLPENRFGWYVKAVGGFVQHEQPALGRQRKGYQELFFLSIRKLMKALVCWQFEVVDQTLEQSLIKARIKSGIRFYILSDGDARVIKFLRQKVNILEHGRQSLKRTMSHHRNTPVCGTEQSDHEFEEGSFACTIF